MDKVSFLSEQIVGSKYNIIGIDTSKQEHLRKLACFGILPGSQIELVQKFPAYVLKVDNTYLAIDKELADQILVL